jgi:hypothetical protein
MVLVMYADTRSILRLLRPTLAMRRQSLAHVLVCCQSQFARHLRIYLLFYTRLEELWRHERPTARWCSVDRQIEMLMLMVKDPGRKLNAEEEDFKTRLWQELTMLDPESQIKALRRTPARHGSR